MKKEIKNEHFIAALKGFLRMGATFDEIVEATGLQEWQLDWLIYQLERIVIAA